jgi:hypothetical protein
MLLMKSFITAIMARFLIHMVLEILVAQILKKATGMRVVLMR